VLLEKRGQGARLDDFFYIPYIALVVSALTGILPAEQKCLLQKFLDLRLCQQISVAARAIDAHEASCSSGDAGVEEAGGALATAEMVGKLVGFTGAYGANTKPSERHPSPGEEYGSR
jgi:hypothetical protein